MLLETPLLTLSQRKTLEVFFESAHSLGGIVMSILSDHAFSVDQYCHCSFWYLSSIPQMNALFSQLITSASFCSHSTLSPKPVLYQNWNWISILVQNPPSTVYPSAFRLQWKSCTNWILPSPFPIYSCHTTVGWVINPTPHSDPIAFASNIPVPRKTRLESWFWFSLLQISVKSALME